MDTSELSRRLVEAGINEVTAASVAQSYAAGDPAHLVHALLIRALWAEVGSGAASSPLSIRNWEHLTERGFPFLDGGAAARLLTAGANADDINSVVRSALVLALYNVTNTVDSGGWRIFEELLGPEAAAGLGWALVVHDPAESRPDNALGELHSSFEGADPGGRFGQPPSDAERVLSGFPDDIRQDVIASIEAGANREATLTWHRQTGRSLTESRVAVEQLAKWLSFTAHSRTQE